MALKTFQALPWHSAALLRQTLHCRQQLLHARIHDHAFNHWLASSVRSEEVGDRAASPFSN